MKVNKWTMGLAALGLVSLPAASQAEETTHSMMTALSATSISGYVSTSINWNMGTGNGIVPSYAFNSGKQDGFNLDVVKLTIEKPLDESQWAAGYKADIIMGPDANVFATQNNILTGGTPDDFALKQAYVALRTPVGNGLDFKIGVWDTIIGYESFDAGSNPNYSRSYGYSIEPTTHTGVLASYQFAAWLSAQAGIANTFGPIINQRANPPAAESYKTYMGSVALTAPEDWGVLAGSTLYGGVINGFNGGIGDNQTSWYAGATVNTPLTGVKVGASFDYLAGHGAYGNNDSMAVAWAAYVSWQMTEKLSLHGRGEYVRTDTGLIGPIRPGASNNAKVLEATATVQYDLWKNVMSRLEFRWDHQANGNMVGYGGTGTPGDSVFGTPAQGHTGKRNNYALVANFIYKF
jgi:hypothetical protein